MADSNANALSLGPRQKWTPPPRGLSLQIKFALACVLPRPFPPTRCNYFSLAKLIINQEPLYRPSATFSYCFLPTPTDTVYISPGLISAVFVQKKPRRPLKCLCLGMTEKISPSIYATRQKTISLLARFEKLISTNHFSLETNCSWEKSIKLTRKLLQLQRN